jgi:hypothetical protein
MRLVNSVLPASTSSVASIATLEYNESATIFQNAMTYTGMGKL